MNETRRAGFGGLDIQRTPMGTRVTLLAERPGLVIGRKGGAIKSLTEAVERQFKFDNPHIQVHEVGAPALNAQIMAEKLANALRRGWHFRRAGHTTPQRIMQAGAQRRGSCGPGARTRAYAGGNGRYGGDLRGGGGTSDSAR